MVIFVTNGVPHGLLVLEGWKSVAGYGSREVEDSVAGYC